MTHREATGEDTAYGFQAAPQAPVRCLSEQDRRKSQSSRMRRAVESRTTYLPGMSAHLCAMTSNRGVAQTDAFSVASRRPIMKKQIGSPIPACFMNADFLGAEPQP